jgi:hypothetical protein
VAVEKRDSFAESLSNQDTPQREEVLGNRNIDVVAESLTNSSSLPLPSTITPPKAPPAEKKTEDALDPEAALERTLERLEALSQGAQNARPTPSAQATPSATEVPTTNSEEAIDIRVAPRLPGEAAPAAVRPRLESRVTPSATTPASVRSYIVLKDLSGGSPKSGSSLGYADSSGLLGVSVLGEADSAAGNFFQVGRRYQFAGDKEPREFVVLGKFRSPKEAGSVHPVLAEPNLWQNMSPQDTLLLGTGVWQKAQ